jgi:hypothetical protein
MEIDQIVAVLDAEIKRLQQVRELLGGGGNGIPSPFVRPRRKHTMSAEARARIAAAQRARWAKQKRAAKKAA